jgi:flagellar biosynthetic protein FliR
MTIPVQGDFIIAFLLALVRASTWVSLAPPFNTKLLPSKVKIAVAFALALAAAPRIDGGAVPTDDIWAFIGAIALQVLVGGLLGFIGLILLSALQVAGGLIDTFGGFTMDSAFDPLSNAQSSVFGRFHQLMATTLLFAIDGHLVLVKGFLASFTVAPADSLAWSDLARMLTRNVGTLFLASIELAGPLIAVMFVVEVSLGLLSKAAPQMNVFQLGFPLKILLTLLLIGGTLIAMPDSLGALVDQVVRGWATTMRFLPGIGG